MYKNFNASSLAASGRQSELIELALTYKFRGMDLDMEDFTTRATSQGVEIARRFLQSANLKVGGYELPVDWQHDEATYKSDLAQLPKTIELAESVNATITVTTIEPATDLMPYHESFEQARQRLAEIAALLEKHGMQLGLAFRAAASHRADRQFQFIHQADDMLTLLKTIGAANVGLALDTWNWFVGGGTIEQLAGLTPDRIACVWLADAPADADVTAIEDTQRFIPGEGGLIDCQAVVDILKNIGYAGPVSIVPHPSTVESLSREQAARKASQCLDALFAGTTKPPVEEETTGEETVEEESSAPA